MDQLLTEREVSKRSGSRWVRYGPLVFWLGILFTASTSGFSAGNTSRFVRPLLRWLFPKLSEADLDWVHFLVRKAAHFTGYAILGWLAHRAFVSSTKEIIRRHWFWWGSLLVVVYALFDEWHQSFVPSRTGSVYDSLIDIAGGLAVLLLFWLFAKRR